MRSIRASAMVALLSLAAGVGVPIAATAQVEQLLQPGPAGEDVSPYSFIPTLPRGNRETNWVFTAVDGGTTHDFRHFVRFDLPAAPANHRVDYAYLWFYYSFDSAGFGEGATTPGTVHCHEVLEDWDESAVTWLDQPTFGPPFDTWDGIDGFQLFFCDVRDLVQDWVSGAKPNLGVALTNPTGRTIGMHSFESNATTDDYKPSLLIGYTPSGTFDLDADGVADAFDNCVIVPNFPQEDLDVDGVGDRCDVCFTAFDPDQPDADGDGIGDRCDFQVADLDGNGRVGPADAATFTAAIGTLAPEPAFDPRCDLDADGAVTEIDYERWEPIYEEFASEVAAAPACGLGAEIVPLLAGIGAFARRRRRS